MLIKSKETNNERGGPVATDAPQGWTHFDGRHSVWESFSTLHKL